MKYKEIVDLVIKESINCNFIIRTHFIRLVHDVCSKDRDIEWQVQFAVAQCLDEIDLSSVQKELEKAFILLRNSDENSSFNENPRCSTNGS